IKSLLDLAPETAELRQPDGSWQEVPAAEVRLEAVVRIKPGARVPLDGIITAGSSAVNQAPVTGESIPVDKTVGDQLFAATINDTGTLEMRVTAASSNTMLARIIHAVEEAQGARAPTQQFVDRFAAVYTPVVFALAMAVALLTPWLMDWTWTQAFYKALVLLVIACPCALVIATPVTLVSALAAAARRGIIIKGGVYLEGARNLKAIALDKTGTITEGKPRLVATELRPSSVDEAQVLRWAALMAGESDHPVSRAIASGLAASEGTVEQFTALPGRGIQGSVDGQELILGNHRLIEDRAQCSAQLEERLAEHEAQGRSITMLASRTEVLAVFAVADTIKETSRQALAELHALGVSSVMLTGDNSA
ncbi:MAG: heavy metal translocating P-type ATPase, partial [Pseudomonas sp.]|nr:heavy metal translocating P-type ATPase [Pseudomonas sp.]